MPTLRYSDFIVNEIDEEGRLVRLTSLEVDRSQMPAVCINISVHNVTGSGVTCHVNLAWQTKNMWPLENNSPGLKWNGALLFLVATDESRLY